jgi:hypothetical protein
MQVGLKREPGLVELVPGNRTLCFTARFKLPINGSRRASATNSSTAAIAWVGATENIGPHTKPVVIDGIHTLSLLLILK